MEGTCIIYSLLTSHLPLRSEIMIIFDTIVM